MPSLGLVPVDLPGSVEDLLALLAESARLDDEESVSVLDHQLQTAALLLERCPGDVELQVAGLVHDLGWLSGSSAHDRAGADIVRALLGERVGRLVGGHVEAKRYLVTVDPDYGARLSARSVETLGFQGSTMTASEVAGFESRADFEALVTLRRADDDAKVAGLQVAALDTWRTALTAIATADRLSH